MINRQTLSEEMFDCGVYSESGLGCHMGTSRWNNYEGQRTSLHECTTEYDMRR